jgi:tight adherence protein C
MDQQGIIILTFVAVAGLVALGLMLGRSRKARVEERLQELVGQTRAAAGGDPVAGLTRTALPRIGAPLLPSSDTERTQLRSRLIHAGIYSPSTLPLFLGVKMILIAVPPVLAVGAILSGNVPLWRGLFFGAGGSALGMLAPGMWLNMRKNARQTSFRRAIPDALDIIMVCLEGGLSLPGAFQRVVGMLRLAHPLLAQEMNIVQRHIQMGRSTGEALREFADRSDLEELRSLASVVLQSERFGASLVKSLRTHAETLRTKRLNHAEELAQKASVKVLFPMLLCIFPAVFIVLIGPAMIQIKEVFAQMNW